jgi:hypothetical protein
MRRLTLFGLAIVAVLALAAVVASSASAVELPEFTVESNSEGTSGTAKLNLTGAAITCTSGSSDSTPITKRLGKNTIHFLGCTLKGEECHSLADTAGNILIGTEGSPVKEGEYHLVRIKSGDAGVWFLISPVHIECKFEALLVVVQGNVLGLITPILSDIRAFEVKVNVVGGKQEIAEFENDGGENVKAKLEGSINGGAFKAATFESANNKFSSVLLTEIVAVAVELPEFSVESASEGTGEAAKLNLTGASITCSSSASDWSAVSKRRGKGLIWFRGCTLKGEECHSLADTAGNILIGTEGSPVKEGEYHLVRIKSGDAGVWFLISPVHIECKFEALLVVVQGNVLGLITPILSDIRAFEVKVNVVGGKQEIAEFENDGGENVKAKLEGSINGGAFKAATFESANNNFSLMKLTEIVKTT